MLEERDFEYFPKLGLVKIKGLPPEDWDNLTTEEQFKNIYDIFGFKIEIKAVQFDY